MEQSYLFVNGKEIHRFKAKASEIVATPFCLGNISKDRIQRRICQIRQLKYFSFNRHNDMPL